jgi:phosphatidylinositol alpha-1,6-mannosyltransferase
VRRLKPLSNPLVDAFYRWQLTTRVARSSRADIIVATGGRATWIAALLPRRVPLVTIGHGTEFGVTASWERALTRFAFHRANFVICVSQFTWNSMYARGVHPRRGAIIHNGADDSQFKMLPASDIHEFQRQHHLEGRRLLLTVGQVNERKGQHVIIRAMPAILKQFPNTHYLMAGLPTDKEPLSALAHNLGVSDHVHFLGRVNSETLVRFVNACDIFAMTSCHTQSGNFEGYGIAVVEAALCGKPAVVSDNSGLAEAVVDGITGVLVPQNDPAGTADAIIALFADDAHRKQMGAAAHQHALTQQTWAKRASVYHETFMELLENATAHHLPHRTL